MLTFLQCPSFAVLQEQPVLYRKPCSLKILSNEHSFSFFFLTTDISFPGEECIKNRVCGANVANYGACSFFTKKRYNEILKPTV